MVRAAEEGRLDSLFHLPALLNASVGLLKLLCAVPGIDDKELRPGFGLSDADCYRVCAWPAALLRPAGAIFASGRGPGAWSSAPAGNVAAGVRYLTCACNVVMMLLGRLLTNRGTPYSQRMRSPAGLASPAAVAEFMHSALVAAEQLQKERGERGSCAHVLIEHILHTAPPACLPAQPPPARPQPTPPI